MGLIKCIDCGKEFSDRIDACPNCYCPKEEILNKKNSKEKIELIKEKKKKNSSTSKEKRIEIMKSLYDCHFDIRRYEREIDYRHLVFVSYIKKINYLSNELDNIEVIDGNSISGRQEAAYRECMSPNDKNKVIDYIRYGYLQIPDFVQDYEAEHDGFNKKEIKLLKEMASFLKKYILNFEGITDRDILKELDYKPKIVKKNNLMTADEMKEFAFNSVFNYIKKDLKEEIINVEKTDFSSNNADYILESKNGKIGLKLIVDIAPNKSYPLYDDNVAKTMAELKYKYVAVRIGVGAKEEVEFDRRKTYKNKEYYFNYEKLNYFSYEDHHNIRYSISDSGENYSFIYENSEKVNPHTVQKIKKNFSNSYFSNDYILELRELFYKYELPIDHFSFYSIYLRNLAEEIKYQLDIKTLFLTFFNILDFCNGLLYSDSEKILEKDVISKVYLELDYNSFLDLNKYERYTFSYYIYNIFNHNRYSNEYLDVAKMKKYKINTFNNFPIYFGFDNLEKDKKKKREINSSKYIYEMLNRIIEFDTTNFEKYLDINMKINNTGIKNALNFLDLSNQIELLLKNSREDMAFLQMYFDITKEFKYKNVYVAYRKGLSSYIELLELDYKMFHLLNEKSKGGKYGFLKYRKDSKIRNQKYNETVQLLSLIDNSFKLKQITNDESTLIERCNILTKELYIEYVEKVKNDPNEYKNFRNRLGYFYTNLLTLNTAEKRQDFKNGVLNSIISFMELIEFKEQKKLDLDKIFDYELEIDLDMWIIEDLTYEILLEDWEDRKD